MAQVSLPSKTFKYLAIEQSTTTKDLIAKRAFIEELHLGNGVIVGVGKRGKTGPRGKRGRRGADGTNGTLSSAYGEIYQDPDTPGTQVVTAPTQPLTPLLTFNRTGLSNQTNPTGTTIEIQTSGIYLVHFDISVDSDGGGPNTLRFVLAINGTPVSNIQGQGSTQVPANTIVNVAMQGLLSLSPADIVNVLVSYDSSNLGTNTLTVYAANLHVMRIA
jgi:hypothetical protein